jgi:hypothetical protein
MATLTITGKSGKQYVFTIYDINTNFKAVGGLYLFTRLLENKTTHKYIYLGITNDLSTRFNNHHKEDCIKKNGETHISIYLESNQTARENAEKDILAAINTTCNEKMN